MNFPEHYVRKLRNGDRKAFQVLYAEMFPKLCVFAHKYVKDRDACVDIVQDVFTRLWDNRSAIKNDSAMSSYLFTSVKNTALNYLKRSNARVKIHQKFTDMNSESMYEYRLLEQEVYANVYNYIKTLPQRSREVMLLTLHGVSNTGIEEELGISVNTVKTLKKHAYKKIKEKFKNLLHVIHLLF